MAAEQALPAFVEPMLATRGQPFNSDDYLFEIKWDGIRMLTFTEQDGYRLMNRHGVNTTERYPEFAFLAELPPGTILDGEMVVFRNGKPDFGLVQGRDKTRSALNIRSRSLTQPATYLVFDLLYARGQSLLKAPLLQRRQRLEELLGLLPSPQLVLSQAIIGAGAALFQEACRQHLEGIMAKKVTSTYWPGKRAADWIKKTKSLSKNYDCLTPEERFRLILAASGRGDTVERERLVRAGKQIQHVVQDHAPHARAFQELSYVTFLHLLEDASRYFEAFAHADRLRFWADDAGVDANDDAAETDADAVHRTANDDHAGVDDSCHDAPTDFAETATPLWKDYIALGQAAGYLLLTNTARWQHFCKEMNVPPFLLWEHLPGFDRLMRALAEAEKTSFSPDEFLRWLNASRPKGMPEITRLTLDPSIGAAADMEAFRQLARHWGG